MSEEHPKGPKDGNPDEQAETEVGVAPGDEPQGEYELSLDEESDLEAVMREMSGDGGEANPGPDAADPGEGAAPAGDPSGEAAEYKEKYMRALADLENLRKRNQRSLIELRRYGHEHAVRELLPVLDNMERAMQAAGDTDNEALAQFIDGVKMIAQQFRMALKSVGVEPVEAEGERFDPNLHEAMQEVPAGDVPPGHVAHQLERGYTLHDRLLRPAKVVVAKAGAAPQGTETAPADEPDEITPDDQAEQ